MDFNFPLMYREGFHDVHRFPAIYSLYEIGVFPFSSHMRFSLNVVSSKPEGRSKNRKQKYPRQSLLQRSKQEIVSAHLPENAAQ